MSVQSPEAFKMPKCNSFLKVLVINNFEATAANNINPAGTVTLPHQNHWCSEFLLNSFMASSLQQAARAYSDATLTGTTC
jgi:hypothetical protein